MQEWQFLGRAAPYFLLVSATFALEAPMRLGLHFYRLTKARIRREYGEINGEFVTRNGAIQTRIWRENTRSQFATLPPRHTGQDTLTVLRKCATLKDASGHFVGGKVPRGCHNFRAHKWG
jgi:hypothetical protein